MAANITKMPILRAISTRNYSAAVPICGVSNYDVKSATLPNRLLVASAENESSISRVSIVFKAGARNETAENLGATHVIRIAAGLSTKNSTQFAIMRHIQQVGANLSVSADRELISYNLEGTREAIEETMPFLTEVATKQVFKPWEISDNVHRLKLELATRPPQQRAIDLLHKAAYRRGLGNSLYIPKHQLGKISSETLQHYVMCNFTAGRAAVIGLGVNHAQLTNYAQGLELESRDTKPEASPYKGGEIRSDKGGDLAFVAIAGQGGALSNTKEALGFAILKHAFGAGPYVHFGSGGGILARSVGNLNETLAISAINMNYSDTGLFGVLIACNCTIAGKLIDNAISVLKSGKISDEDFNRGKNLLKTATLLELESGNSSVQVFGTHATILGTVFSPNQIVEAIDAITPANVNEVAKKLASSKLSIASVGNLRCVPFLDELK